MLIPRELLFGNPERVSPQISPDGRYLAYIAPDAANVLQVWLRDLADDTERLLTADKKRGIRLYFWTYAPATLVYLQDRDGDENWHIYALNVVTGDVRDLTPFPGIHAQPGPLKHRMPNQMLVGLNKTDPRKHDVYRVDLTTGSVELDTENPGTVAAWYADSDLNVRVAVAYNRSGGQDILYRSAVSESWRTLRSWGPDDEGSTVGVTGDGKRLYLLSNHGVNAMRLTLLDPDSGEETLLADDPIYDVGSVFVHPTSREVQAVGFYRDRLEWQALDPSIQADLDAIARVRAGEFRLVSRDLADKTWIVAHVADDGPVYYHRYDRDAKASTLLFSHQPRLEGQPLTKMTPVTFAARDGIEIHGYLTLPRDAEARDLPAVILVHGGPWGRDVWGFSPQAQWLANRGYAVLQPNFRGSTGYGRDFLNAGNREWGAKMQDDVSDGVAYLVERGIADPKRIGILGVSYGGYAALAGLTFTPDLFAAGVDLCGPSNLNTLLKSVPPYWAPRLAVFKHRVGDPDTEGEFLSSRSPLLFADRIRAPLLIGQGANDPRVTQAESEQIVEAMRKAGLPVEYVLYTDEGHGLVRPENSLHFWGMAERFLADHLGGQCEPLSDIPGNSAVVR